MSFSSRRSNLVRSIRPTSRLALRASMNSSVRGRYTPFGWKPGRYGAGERGAERSRICWGATGEGDGPVADGPGTGDKIRVCGFGDGPNECTCKGVAEEGDVGVLGVGATVSSGELVG